MTPRHWMPLFTLLFAGFAQADAGVDIMNCTTLAGSYSKNPFALSLQELDSLRTCLNWQFSAMVNDAQQQRAEHAIERNFGSRRASRDD